MVAQWDTKKAGKRGSRRVGLKALRMVESTVGAMDMVTVAWKVKKMAVTKVGKMDM